MGENTNTIFILPYMVLAQRGRSHLDRHIEPIIIGFLVGTAAWIVDAVVFLYLNSGVSVLGAFMLDVPLYRLVLRLLILLCTVFLGGIKAYAIYMEGYKNLGLNEQVPEESKNFAKAIYTPADIKEREIAEKQLLKEEAKKAERELKRAVKTDKIFAKRKTKPVKRRKTSKKEVFVFTPKGQSIFCEDAFCESEVSAALWQYAGRLGEVLRLKAEELQAIRGLCYFYNIGRFGVCEGQFSADAKENALLSHSEIGAKMAESIPELAPSAELIRFHHERFDGSGLMAMAGLEIPLGSRIFAVAWVYNALTRPDGSWCLKGDDALETLYQYSGTALDPELVAAFIGMMSGGKYFVDNKAKSTVWNS